jgi:hypothetical protein
MVEARAPLRHRYMPPSAMPPRTPQATAAGLHTPPPPLPTASPATDTRAPACSHGGRGASLTDFNVLTNPHTGFPDSRRDGPATSRPSSEGHRSPPAEQDVTSVVEMGFSRSQVRERNRFPVACRGPLDQMQTH